MTESPTPHRQRCEGLGAESGNYISTLEDKQYLETSNLRYSALKYSLVSYV